MNLSFNLTGGDFSKAGIASSEVKRLLKKINVPVKVIKRTVIAVYEAEINVVAHAFNGIINIEIASDHIHVVVKDEGPGIADISKAMQEGWSTASSKVREMGFGAGMGLPNMKKNADKLSVNSEVGVGTTVEITNYFTETETSRKSFHHALKINKVNCIGCSHCMNACPTQAIRIRDGKAGIQEHRCIDCGECYRVCPANAIYVEQDDFSAIFSYKHSVALINSVLIGQFNESLTRKQIFDAIKDIGFTDVFEIESCADFIAEEMVNHLKNKDIESPLISCFCPAVVRLVQVKYPSLISHLLPIKPPIDVAAVYYKKKLVEAGVNEHDIGLFYITPCAAKIAAVKSPVGESKSVVDGIINLDAMFNRINPQLSKIKTKSKKSDDNDISAMGIQWPLTQGETHGMPCRSIAIDGITNVIDFLEKIESHEIKGIDFLELRACDESCAGGILTSSNRFLTAARIRKRALGIENPNSSIQFSDVERSFLRKNSKVGLIEPRAIDMIDDDREKAFEKMNKVRKMMCYLPGFDCGVCGSPTCQALAEDIVRGEANLSHCMFLQRMMEKNKKLSSERAFKIIEQIWGKDRLDKNCFKKGASNESF